VPRTRPAAGRSAEFEPLASARGGPTVDPVAALAGMLTPIGGAKGFALAYLLEALTGGIIGPALSRDVVDPFDADRAADPQAVAHLVIVLRPEVVDLDNRRAERLNQRESAVTQSGDRVPGAGRRLTLDGVLRLEPGLRDELAGWAHRLGASEAAAVLART
jgi:(2R)-3-sulfolactate dehydrogenase (NADP+)